MKITIKNQFLDSLRIIKREESNRKHDMASERRVFTAD